jgi:hypothetical protein
MSDKNSTILAVTSFVLGAVTATAFLYESCGETYNPYATHQENINNYKICKAVGVRKWRESKAESEWVYRRTLAQD